MHWLCASPGPVAVSSSNRCCRTQSPAASPPQRGGRPTVRALQTKGAARSATDATASPPSVIPSRLAPHNDTPLVCTGRGGHRLAGAAAGGDGADAVPAATVARLFGMALRRGDPSQGTATAAMPAEAASRLPPCSSRSAVARRCCVARAGRSDGARAGRVTTERQRRATRRVKRDCTAPRPRPPSQAEPLQQVPPSMRRPCTVRSAPSGTAPAREGNPTARRDGSHADARNASPASAARAPAGQMRRPRSAAQRPRAAGAVLHGAAGTATPLFAGRRRSAFL